MATDNIGGVWRNGSIHSIPSVKTATRKPKPRDKKKEKPYQDSIEDKVVISSEEETKSTGELTEDGDDAAGTNQIESLPGGTINIVVK